MVDQNLIRLVAEPLCNVSLQLEQGLRPTEEVQCYQMMQEEL